MSRSSRSNKETRIKARYGSFFFQATVVSSSSTRSKGQWFLISAVVITGVFLTLSGLFKSYFIVDPSDTARTNEEYYFSNIRQQFTNVASASPCNEIDRNLREFRAFEEREMANKGYLLFLNYTVSGCSVSKPGILVASNRMVVCQNVDPADILPNAISVTCARV